jgi:hypothetical protein
MELIKAGLDQKGESDELLGYEYLFSLNASSIS